MAHRFRFLGQRQGPQQWELLLDEWHHLLKVLRLPVGSELEIADGMGHVALGRLTHSSKNAGELEVTSEEFYPAPSPSTQITLAIGALKPQSADELLPYLIELGMDGIEVFASQSVDKNRMQDKVRERWDRIATAAVKQCKRPWAPVISWSDGLETLIDKASAFPNKIFLDPDGEQNLARWLPQHDGPTLAIIGSEKGLDADEVMALRQHGFSACRIQGSILRATTAAIASAALLRQILPYKS
jgi:16S rRNA (uracil1498-N3)-methyltransferase